MKAPEPLLHSWWNYKGPVLCSSFESQHWCCEFECNLHVTHRKQFNSSFLHPLTFTISCPFSEMFLELLAEALIPQEMFYYCPYLCDTMPVMQPLMGLWPLVEDKILWKYQGNKAFYFPFSIFKTHIFIWGQQ